MRSLKISPYPRSFSFFKFIVHAFHLPAIILSTNKEDIQRTLKQHLEVAPPKWITIQELSVPRSREISYITTANSTLIDTRKTAKIKKKEKEEERRKKERKEGRGKDEFDEQAWTNGWSNNYCSVARARAKAGKLWASVEEVKNARGCARVSQSNRQYYREVLPARRLCGRFGADYGFVLSLIPVSYGQQFTGYHRTAINLGVSSRCSRGCSLAPWR